MKSRKRKTNGQILPALVAVGGACGLAATSASALELGDITIDSSLGHPLRASIAYALSPNEQIFDFCIFLRPGLSANGIPNVSNAGITIADNTIVINGRTPIREPLLAMQLSVNCPYTAHLARDYTLMIDPASSADSEPVTLGNATAPQTPVPMATVTTSDIISEQQPRPAVRNRVRSKDETPIAASSRYQVKTGDSLSEIASRIENRSIALWPAVEEIFAANPDAFLNNDPDLLKAGSWLVIPDLSGARAASGANDTRVVAQTTVAPDTAAAASYTGAATAETAVVSEVEPVVAEVAEPEVLADPEPAPVESAAAPEMRPGDIIVGTDSPFLVPIGDDEVIDIPDSAMEAPQVSRPVPAITGREIGDSGESDGSSAWSWLLWLGGAGLAMILGLFMFGRQIRERFGSVPVGAPATPSRRRTDTVAPAPPRTAPVNFEFDEDTLNSRSITLDADLDSGSGLQDASDMTLAQDFGFSATGATTTQVDMPISEQASREEESVPTDIIPPNRQELETILENEILPSEDDSEDYDLSMMVDATKHILEDNNTTAKDLMAVAVDTDDDADDDTNEYTLNREVDYQILEQDYEEELTATQALNKEIEEAARALVERMDELDVSGGGTAEVPTLGDAEITAELTAKLPASGDAENDELGDSSAIVPELTAETAEMPLGDSDATLEMESDSINTKKAKAS